jgi:glucose-1-phosphate cytidylyltransferase
MKVVLFCGGFGMRLFPTTENIPKPLVSIGDKPVLWQIMKYYAYFGHKDFVLCLGYKGDQVKNYFLNYNEYLSNDFVLSNGGKDKKILGQAIDDWSITFVETGLNSNIGQRLKLVEKYVNGDPYFLANYSDGVTDLQLPRLIDFFNRKDKIACLLSVKPFYSYHALAVGRDNSVSKVIPSSEYGMRINGGFFIFKNSIFEYLTKGNDLVNDAFPSLISQKQLVAYPFNGFWANMDTYKDKQRLDDLASEGKAYWQVWNSSRPI